MMSGVNNDSANAGMATSAVGSSGGGSSSNSGLYGLSTSSLQYSASATTSSANAVPMDDFETGAVINRKQQHNESTKNSSNSINSRVRLTAKPHAFTGAVLSPKHALELTPTLCLQLASQLADHHKNSMASSNISSANTSTVTHYSVPYTVWITDAWRVLGWAEPSAALFWEMATMYHALAAAGRELAHHHAGLMIPPILSCGSTSSLGSNSHTNSHTVNSNSNENAQANRNKKLSSVASAKELPVWLVGTFLLLHCEEFAYLRNISGQDDRRFSTTAVATGSAVSGTTGTAAAASSTSFLSAMSADGGTTGAKLDFPGFFKNPSLSPRSRLHATWNNDSTHCTAFLLRHLRKILLLSAVSHNHEATVACMHLAAMPLASTNSTSTGTALLDRTDGHSASASVNRLLSSASTTGTANGSASKKYDTNELRRLHADEHGNVGLQVRLTMEDLERLDLVLQPPRGGAIDEPPLRLGEFLWRCLYHDHPPPPTAAIPLAEVEREIRQQLELELAVVAGMEVAGGSGGGGGPGDALVASSSVGSADSATQALGRLSMSDSKASSDGGRASTSASECKPDSAGISDNNYHKEQKYHHLRGTTVLFKPNPPESPSTGGGASVASGDAPNFISSVALGRLHDLVLSDCSDAHFYLLQPFEHVTIANCSGCTLVVGAVAGLLNIVDCEKLIVTTASRRILISNSSDVVLNIFTPSPPLLVGDNRSCQFAPYNTFYDGMRDDLLATGLAAAVISDGGGPQSSSSASSPFHRSGGSDNDATWPPLQCASNKWKQPIEVTKLEVPQVPGSPGAGTGLNSPVSLSPGADDRAMGTTALSDTTLLVSTLVSPADFQVLFLPLESEASRQRRLEAEDMDASGGDGSSVTAAAATTGTGMGSMESQYCQLLAEVLQLSPFRLPLEYERRALIKAERMKNIQQAVQKSLSLDQQRRFEEELNRGFRDWLVTSGNLRQVLDLVRLEVKH